MSLSTRAFATMAAIAMHAAAAPLLVTVPEALTYGQAVSIDLRDTSPVFLPAMRYTRAGNRFTLDYEQGGSEFGPYPPNLGWAPVPIGELPPGRYVVQARLHDASRPEGGPAVASLEFGVAAPREPGVYLVPREPRAHGDIEIFLNSAAYFDPASLKVSTAAGLVRVDFDYLPGAAPPAPAPGMTTMYSVRIPSLARGGYRLEAWARPIGGGGAQRYFSTSFTVRAEVEVVEYYHEGLDHYFMAATPEDIAMLDAGAYGGWKRTGQRFGAWLEARDAPAAAVPVCRFYGAIPKSHFHTADPSECARLREVERADRALARAQDLPFIGWSYEGVAFYALLPASGDCPRETVPVYRAHNGRSEQGDAAYRYMVSASVRHAMAGWADEGVAFCAAG